MNLIWWIVSFGIVIGLFWLAKRAEPDLRSSADGMHFDCKYKDIPFGPEDKQSAADTMRQMRWHRGRGELVDDRVLVVAGPVREGEPLRAAAAGHRPQPEPSAEDDRVRGR